MIKQVLKDTAIYGGANFIFKAFMILVIPVYTRMLSVDEYGIVNLVQTGVGLFGIVINCGVNNALQRFYFLDNNIRSKTEYITSGIILLVFTCFIGSIFFLVFIYPFFSQYFLNNGITFPIVIFAIAISIVTQISQYGLDILRLKFMPWHYSIISISSGTIGIILTLVLLCVYKFGYYSIFAGNLFGLVCMVFIMYPFIKANIIKCFDLDKIRSIFTFGYPFILGGLAYWVFNSTDRWVLLKYNGLEQVGLFSFVFTFSSILYYINSAFGQAWSPLIMKLVQTDSDYRKKIGLFFALWLYILIFIVSIILMSGVMLANILGPVKYHSALYIVPYLLIGVIFSSTTQITALGISLSQKTKYIMYISIFIAVINLFLNIALIPKYSVLGAAISFYVSNFLLTVLYLFVSQKFHPFQIPWKIIFILLFIIAFLTMGSKFLLYSTWSVKLLFTFILIVLGYMIYKFSYRYR